MSSRVLRPAAPFAGICGLALAASALQTAGTNWAVLGLAAGIAILLTALACLSTSSRLIRAALPALPFAVHPVLALLRQAQGGSTSGYAPLAILPVVWVALTQGHRAVAAVTGWTTLLFATPIVVVGAPMYPQTGWRGVVLWTAVAATVGYVAHHVVSAQRRSTVLETTRAANLDRLIATQTAISVSDLDVDGLLRLVANEALAVAGADAACVELLDGDDIVCTAAAGTAREFIGLRLPAVGSITGECFRSGRILICTDSESDSRVAREACRMVGARSMIVVPLTHDSHINGVLIVWSVDAHDFTGPEAQLLALLANTIGAALARAELTAQLVAQAVTDELTGLANRRAWHERLTEAMARSRRSGNPLSVLVLDIDGLKQVNDGQGHVAGDQLLKDVSDAWRCALRSSDLLGRLGGDEFAVILEDTHEEAAFDVMTRLDAALKDEHTASTGLAVWDGVENPTALVARADAQMYHHKRRRNGRSRHPVSASVT